MGSSRRITRFGRFVAVAIVAIVTNVRLVSAAQIDHVRGVILGTTQTSIDIGTPARDDVHFDMEPEPFVVIAEPGEFAAIDVGSFVSVVLDATGKRARCVTLVPDTAHVFSAGRFPWDLPGAKASIVNGRVASRDANGTSRTLTVAFGTQSLRFVIPAHVPVIALRAGSRAALLSPHAAFVFGRTSDDRLSDRVQSIIVADGKLSLPF